MQDLIYVSDRIRSGKVTSGSQEAGMAVEARDGKVVEVGHPEELGCFSRWS